MVIHDIAHTVLRRHHTTPPPEQIAQNVAAGAQRLADITARWQGSPPQAAALADARCALEGIRISLLALESQNQPPNRAA